MRPLPPLPLSVLRFTGIQSYSYTDQRKVEADVEVTEDRTGDLSLRKPRTSQLSHDCSDRTFCAVTPLKQGFLWLNGIKDNATFIPTWGSEVFFSCSFNHFQAIIMVYYAKWYFVTHVPWISCIDHIHKWQLSNYSFVFLLTSSLVSLISTN